MGDQLGFRSELLTRSGKHAGWSTSRASSRPAALAALRPARGAVSLAGGEIMVQALVSIASDMTEVAIVGGTGVYRSASGYIESVSRGDAGLSDDIFHLVLP